MSIGLLSTSCAQSLAEAKVERSNLERETSPGVANADLEGLSSGNAEFAFRLYQELKEEEEGNFFYSPYSISSALAMTYGGARGNTEREMAQTLSFTLPQDRFHPAFNALDQKLSQRTNPVDIGPITVEGVQLEIANSLWGQIGYSFLPEYLDLLALNYGAEMRMLDFVDRADAARRAINRWVEDATEGTIKDIVPDGILNARTRLVLVNAIYFNAKWEDPFSKSDTRRESFNLLDGSTVMVPMMSQDEVYRYWKGSSLQVFEMPYLGRELAMGILLPDSGKFYDVEKSLNSGQINGIIGNLESEYLDLTMPKFEFESEFALRETLSRMGMRDAFENADFSGMDGTRDLVLNDALHKSFVAVDERGTEASAASSVFADIISNPMYPLELTVDRPFVFWIRDIPTGTFLFIGRVLNPEQ
jgi:serpin B